MLSSFLWLFHHLYYYCWDHEFHCWFVRNWPFPIDLIILTRNPCYWGKLGVSVLRYKNPVFNINICKMGLPISGIHGTSHSDQSAVSSLFLHPQLLASGCATYLSSNSTTKSYAIFLEAISLPQLSAQPMNKGSNSNLTDPNQSQLMKDT